MGNKTNRMFWFTVSLTLALPECPADFPPLFYCYVQLYSRWRGKGGVGCPQKFKNRFKINVFHLPIGPCLVILYIQFHGLILRLLN